MESGADVGIDLVPIGQGEVDACRSANPLNASVLLDRRRSCTISSLRGGSGTIDRSSWGSDIALDAAANRDSSSENITLGSVARRRRGLKPDEVKEPAAKSVDGRLVSASFNCKFLSDKGLPRFDSSGGGIAKYDLPSARPDGLMGVDL